MKKYVIKNCPNLTTSYYGTGETIHNQCGLIDDDLCANCNYCVLKQIVELCKNIKSINKRNSYVGEYIEFTQHSPLAEEILELLDIQEVE